MERRFTSGGPAADVTIERASGSNGSGNTIVGYGAVYYDGSAGSQYELWPGAVERIERGAFDAVLSQDTVALMNHNADALLGRVAAGTLKLSVDSRGLRYKISLPDSPVGQNVAVAVQRGDLRGSSFSFDLAEGGESWFTENGLSIRLITKVAHLYDVGPVTFPAYEGTTAGARTKEDAEGIRAAIAARQADEEARRRRRVRADAVARGLV